MKLVCQGGDDAEVAAASPQVPVEVLVFGSISREESPFAVKTSTESTFSQASPLTQPAELCGSLHHAPMRRPQAFPQGSPRTRHIRPYLKRTRPP
jgi:hypothetical protein